MKKSLIFASLVFLLIQISISCGNSKRTQLEQKELDLQKWELELKEKELDLIKREQEFKASIQRIESNSKIQNADNLKESVVKPYMYGVPPAPPFKDIELKIETDPVEGCSEAPNNLIGYIIEVKPDEAYNTVFILQDENGVRHKCSIRVSSMSNADSSWLPYILIPGNKLSMKVQYCGSGGYTFVMYMRSMKR